jgi:hypothetical protein
MAEKEKTRKHWALLENRAITGGKRGKKETGAT